MKNNQPFFPEKALAVAWGILIFVIGVYVIVSDLNIRFLD